MELVYWNLTEIHWQSVSSDEKDLVIYVCATNMGNVVSQGFSVIVTHEYIDK